MASRARSAAWAAASFTWTMESIRAGPVSWLSFVASVCASAMAAGQGRKSLARSADTFVERREQGREPVLLLGDARCRRADAVAGLDRRLAHPVELRPDRFGGPDQPLRADLGVPIATDNWSFTSLVRRPT